MQVVGLTCLAGLTVMTMFQTYALDRQVGAVSRHRGAVPSIFDRDVTLAAHQSAIDDVIRGTQGQRVAILWSVVASFMLLILGCRKIDDFAAWMTAPGLSRDTLILGLVLACSFVISLPSRYYANRTPVGAAAYLKRQVKILGLGILFGIPLVWTSLSMQRAGHGVWWLYAVAALAAASVLAPAFYGRVILPRLSVLTPVRGAVHDQVATLLRQVGLRNAGIFARTTRRRAGERGILILGLGSTTRVVIAGTLLQSLEAEEISALVAHQLGHRLARHGQLRLAACALRGLVIPGLLGWLGNPSRLLPDPGLRQVTQPDMTAFSFFTALLLVGLVSRLLAIAGHAMERHFDFQADSFATGLLGRKGLTRALLKLSADGGHKLTPDPLYSLINDPVPPAALRITRLQETAAVLAPLDLADEGWSMPEQLTWIGRGGLLAFHGNDVALELPAAPEPPRPTIIVAPARKSRRRSQTAGAKRVRAAASMG